MDERQGRRHDGRSDSSSDDNGPEEPSGNRTSAWEWAVAGLGALLVFSSVAFMLHQALTEPDTPPMIEVTVDSIVPTRYGFLVQFQARNHGQRTASGLLVEGELKADTGTVETSQATLSYVPAEARRGGGLFFTNDPRQYVLEVRARGYARP